MNDKDLKQLIDAFYDGTINETEEKKLKDFFLGNATVPAKWEKEQKCFKALYSDSEILIPEGLAERLEEQINLLSKNEKKQTQFRFLYWISSLAAIALLCIGIFISIENQSKNRLTDTYKDPREAAIAAEKALGFMSTQLNKGLDQVSDAEFEIDKVNKVITKQLKENN